MSEKKADDKKQECCWLCLRGVHMYSGGCIERLIDYGMILRGK